MYSAISRISPFTSGPRYTSTAWRSTANGFQPLGSVRIDANTASVINGNVPNQIRDITPIRTDSGPPTDRYTSKATDLCSISSMACQFRR
ncbi:Uncharacterised protein [Mycobacteroides abscessus subsp. abscessus]|nr:Uncharacterised protein [Mycobacteroides abscessus subsp. abscessus]